MLISVVVVAAVLGTIMLAAQANAEDTTTSGETDRTYPPLFCGPRGGIGKRWLANLTDEQREELKTMAQEFREAVKAKLDEWGVQIEHGWLMNLTEEQRTELKTMRQEFQDAVKAKLEEWGVEIPAFKGPNGWLNNLTEEQHAELRAMTEQFRNAVQAKLDEWGVEAPALPSRPEFPNQMGFRGFGPMRRGPGGFGFGVFQKP